MNNEAILKDNFGRVHEYLRISLLETCNFQCNYCMPDSKPDCIQYRMEPDEIIQIARIFAEKGIRKIRLTGGEPLLRKDLRKILQGLHLLPVKLAITTNGFLIDKHIQSLLDFNVHQVNVSLDSLHPQNFFSITHRDVFSKVWDNIHLLLKHNFLVKINVVVMRGQNHQEIRDFILLTQNLPIQVRFIEYMPFCGNKWNAADVFTHEEIANEIKGFPGAELVPNIHPSETAKTWTIPGHIGTVATISTLTDSFCGGCNRIRITSDGKMKNCLFSKDETDLLTALREGNDIRLLLENNLKLKYFSRGGQIQKALHEINPFEIENRSMNRIGG